MRHQWHPTRVLLPGKSHWWRSLEGCSPWGRWGSDTTEWLHFHFSLSCIGEGNGNPLQCSCLENPRDGGACGLPSMGSHRVGHNWSDLAAVAATEAHSQRAAKTGSPDYSKLSLIGNKCTGNTFPQIEFVGFHTERQNLHLRKIIVPKKERK